MKRAAVFDVDGTLADTNHLHVTAWWEAFRQAGHQVPMHAVHRAVGLPSTDLIAHLLGSANPIPPPVAARLGVPLPATGNRAEYLRARWRHGLAFPLRSQDSAGLAALAEAEMLIVRPPDAPGLDMGADIEIISLA